MAEAHTHGEEHGELFRAYMVVAAALGGFTLSSFVVNRLVTSGHLSTLMGFALILGVAVVKATLVGLYFMHLKWDWGRLFFMIVPAFILGTMMMLVLLPDVVFDWKNDVPEPPAPHVGNQP
jgi:cytochrome c oxidase subunit 4